jgi:hypothetical protein
MPSAWNNARRAGWFDAAWLQRQRSWVFPCAYQDRLLAFLAFDRKVRTQVAAMAESIAKF